MKKALIVLALLLLAALPAAAGPRVKHRGRHRRAATSSDLIIEGEEQSPWYFACPNARFVWQSGWWPTTGLVERVSGGGNVHEDARPRGPLLFELMVEDLQLIRHGAEEPVWCEPRVSQ